jgi:predicted permease
VTLLQDLRYAFRTLRKTPAFTLTALAALALGIGANTAIFSVINAVLLKPLTFPQPERIVQFLITSPNGPNYGASATRFNVWRQQTDVLDDVTAYEFRLSGLNLTGGDAPEQIRGIHVSANYFRLFGAPLERGRVFTAEEDLPNGGRVAVISHALWQRRFGSDPNIIGRTLLLSGVPHAVIGVVAPTFITELDTPPDVWLPFQIDPNSSDHAQYFVVVGRLKPGVTIAAANARLQLAADRFRAKFPNIVGPRDSFAVEPYEKTLVSDAKPSLLILAGAVSFVLLIACANVANLLLVRATGRRRELAIRAAIGAGRSMLVRQLLTESVVLSIGGGALGLGLGSIGVRALLAINPGNLPRIGGDGSLITMDLHVVLFTLLVSAATGVIFGLIPALGISRVDLAAPLKEGGGRSGTGRRQNKARSVLVITEVALALVLLIGAALLIRTFAALRGVDPGFDAHNVLTLRMSLQGSRFSKTAEVTQLIRDAVERVEALPGTVVASASYSLPLEGGFGVPFNIVGRAASNGRYDGRGWIGVSPKYFETFRVPVLRGRLFQDRDDAGASRVAIINQAFAKQFWANGEPLGERVILGRGYGPEFEEPERQIIGVVADVHDSGLNRNPAPMVFVPLAQVTDGITALATRAATIAWIVRTNVAPYSLRAAIEKELRQASGGLPVASVRSMDEIRAQSTASQDFNMTLLVIFGAAALTMAVIGIYGLMAYSVQQRTQEMGIRLALGADARTIRNMLIGQGMRLALAGIAIGLAAAAALTRLLANLLFGVSAWDPLVFVAVPVVLIGAALLAVWIPARRAARIDPLDALRHA